MATREKHRDPIPDSFASIEEAGEFWDTHSTADYEHLMKDVHFDVNLQRRTFLVPIEGEIAREINTVARQEGLGLETVVNVWLREKLTAISSKPQTQRAPRA
ncbi:MAG: hypothetical protein AUJ92_12800 [Armatimonadetes bacterium CG2_30_59_28]|nr:hypothetical protein [Armatimonadota bacterium]OIO93212.1 MAG: hypothetical protein AUJ92_12800 [Armatimonadetes bacterium CG2_30_59_28]PIU67264.1 MAG: hypothetical protein COS85_01405 [Armatimonadetes bacterium CG07_land_8_20_14_0_80_59_28]PIX44219.1 MAG: hypothetical protein COZ56_05125 [Armatimonadetes bacterium CG_4_8_14_3_um_filter_58_9]PIY41519.1 MAG: hypothetical protein COZ05_15610 [Armatimonadetes bacterium CG_4_10_14_3_um_filter_59_10]